jgi:hypothetical protein
MITDRSEVTATIRAARLLSHYQSPCLQRRGDLRPAQPNFDPISRDGYLLNNVPEEASQLDVRRGEPSLGKRERIVQSRIQRMSIKIERCECVTDVDQGGQQHSQAIEHQPFDIRRRDAHSLLCLRTFTSQKLESRFRKRHVENVLHCRELLASMTN